MSNLSMTQTQQWSGRLTCNEIFGNNNYSTSAATNANKTYFSHFWDPVKVRYKVKDGVEF